jgi:hypothetical protein
MSNIIKVLIKEPFKPAYYDEIPNELHILQFYVGADIETVRVASDVIAIVNGESLIYGLPLNVMINGHYLFGTVILAGVDESGEEFASLPESMQKPAYVRAALPGIFEKQKTRRCPICKREYSTRPAISRRKPIEICPECGQQEALEDYWQACQKQKNAAREG